MTTATPDLVDKIPLSTSCLLILGCGDGALGAAFKRRNPRATTIGLERDRTLAGAAVAALDRVHCLDLDTAPLPRFPARPDTIVFAPGLIEHLRAPRDTLRDMVRLLAPNGLLVLCVPNGAHWGLTDALLRGLPADLLRGQAPGDGEPHPLALFTPDSTRRLLRAEGLEPLDAQEVTGDEEQAAAFARHLRPALQALGIDPDAYAQRATPTHHIWRASNAPVQPIQIAACMLPHVGGVSEVRVVEPLRALACAPSVRAHITHRAPAPAQAGDHPSIYLLHRPALLGAAGLDTVRAILRRGWLVVLEFDDHPSQIAVLHRSDVQNFRAVHAIQTSTPALAEVFARENPEVAVFPNAILELPAPRNFADPGRTTMLFAALNREDDWPEHVDAVNAAAALAGPRLHLHVINDRAFFDALATPHKTFTPLCDYTTYLDILAGCEIAFMPLRDTLFNRCKSDLKFLEAGAQRVVPLASPVVYGSGIADGQTGVLFATPAELQARLLALLANPDRARGIADAARGHVANHRMLAYQVAGRAAWFRDLWARREDLTAALLARVPELAET